MATKEMKTLTLNGTTYEVVDSKLRNNSLIYRSTLTTTDNLNSITTPGIYYIATDQPANMPESLNYCTLFVWQSVGTYGTCQILFSGNRLQTEYRRRLYGNPEAWTSWAKMATTNHASTGTEYGIASGDNYGHTKFVTGLASLGAENPGTGNGTSGSAYQTWVAAQAALKATWNSGWQDFPFVSGFTTYTGSTLKYRRIGNMVELSGVATPTSAIAASGTARIGVLPTGYQPGITVSIVCQGSGKATWLLTINTEGVCTLARYGAAANEEAAAGVWLPMHAMFTTAQAIPS